MTDIQPVPDAARLAAGSPAHDETTATLYGPKFQQNPGELYRELRREHGTVAPVLLVGDVPAWLVLGYREIHQVISNPQLFGYDCRRWNLLDQLPPNWPLRPYVTHNPSILFAEGEEHWARLTAMSDAFAEVDQFELRSHCERTADLLIDGFASRGDADLMADYALAMPLLVLGALFGLSDAESLELLRDMIATVETERPMEGYLRVREAMEPLLAAKRERPGPDVPSRLLAHPTEHTDEELVADLIMLITLAQCTTPYWIGNTIRLMLTDDRFAVTLSGGRRSVAEAMNEVLWEDTPLQNWVGRYPVRATQLGGQRIGAGDLVVLGIAAANADPQVWPDSGTRAEGNHAHLSFGHGERGCPYPTKEVAEVIARTAVEVLLDRLPDVMLSVPAQQLEWLDSVWIRGLAALPVSFTPVTTLE